MRYMTIRREFALPAGLPLNLQVDDGRTCRAIVESCKSLIEIAPHGTDLYEIGLIILPEEDDGLPDAG